MYIAKKSFIHIYIYLCIYIYIYIDICVYICIYICVYIYICIFICVLYVCICIYRSYWSLVYFCKMSWSIILWNEDPGQGQFWGISVRGPFFRAQLANLGNTSIICLAWLNPEIQWYLYIYIYIHINTLQDPCYFTGHILCDFACGTPTKTKLNGTYSRWCPKMMMQKKQSWNMQYLKCLRATPKFASSENMDE